MVGEVEFEFEQRSEMQQAVAQGLDTFRYATTQLTERQVFLSTRLRGNQVSHGLSTRQIHLTVEKRPLGKLTRTRHTATRLYEPSEHLLLDIQTTVASDLHRILARITVRNTKDRYQHLIQHLILAAQRTIYH